MTEDVSLTLEMAADSMKKAISHLETELTKIRAGKANPQMLDGIVVDYYGSPTPIAQVGNISVLDARTLAAEIALVPGADEEEVQKSIGGMLDKRYTVQTRYQQNRSLYSVMQSEKWVIYAILSLILIVAAFNMIGALTMLVLEKKGDITTLHALGGSRSFIQKIFLTEGLLLAGIGGGIGMLLALSIALAQIHFQLIPLQGGSFLIAYFPVELHGADFLLVGVTVLVIAFLASWVPARKAARQQFVLRSE